MKGRTTSTSMAAPPGLSNMSSPLMLAAGVTDLEMWIGSTYEKGTESSSSSSSLGVSSLCGSSTSASSGYLPRSDGGRWTRCGEGRSQNDATSRWNWASDRNSSSSGRDSEMSDRMRGAFS